MKPWKKYLIEFLVIVIGILTAIQLEDWNQNRKDRDNERLLLNELHQEFTANKNQLKKVTDAHRISLNATKIVIDMMPINPKKVDLDTLGKYLNRLFFTWTFNPTQGSINSLLNSNTINIIQNDSLRALIIKWNDIKDDYAEAEIIARNHVLNYLDPYLGGVFGLRFNLRDKRINLKELETIKFEHSIKLRRLFIREILRDPDQELVTLQRTIDDIIRLSANEGF